MQHSPSSASWIKSCVALISASPMLTISWYSVPLLKSTFSFSGLYRKSRPHHQTRPQQVHTGRTCSGIPRTLRQQRGYEDKIEVIRAFPRLTSQRQLREFTGLVIFYRRFLPSCAAIMQPLNQLLTHPKDKSSPLSGRRRPSLPSTR